jgi:hypothetical protein
LIQLLDNDQQIRKCEKEDWGMSDQQPISAERIEEIRCYMNHARRRLPDGLAEAGGDTGMLRDLLTAYNEQVEISGKQVDIVLATYERAERAEKERDELRTVTRIQIDRNDELLVENGKLRAEVERLEKERAEVEQRRAR